MLQRQNSIVWLPAWLDACGLWRMYLPSLTMPGSSLFVFQGLPDFNKIAGCDVAVVQRCCTTAQYTFIKQAAALGIKLVYDLDDNVWDLPEYNPARPALMQYRDGFYHCIRSVDVVSVSTRTLKRIVEQRIKDLTNVRTGKKIPVIVAENRILPGFFAPPVPPAEDKVVIGWAGSHGHGGDLRLVQGALEQFTNVPAVEIELRGLDLLADNPVRRASNYRFRYWTPVAEYGARMPCWRWNIALAPVTDHEFNASKSNIKMIEAGYCGIPCLASWVQPYADFCMWDSELKYLLCSGQTSFARKLYELVNDRAMREYYGSRMRKVVDDHYSLDKLHPGWQAVFEAVRTAQPEQITYQTDVEATKSFAKGLGALSGPLPEVTPWDGSVHFRR